MTPSKNLQKLASSLFESTDDQQRLIDSLTKPPHLPTAVNWLQDNHKLEWSGSRPAWLPEFVDLTHSKLGKHSGHEEGQYYLLDPSSVFAARPLLEIGLNSAQILDVCSAPGGKAIFAWRALKPNLLVCNEVIGKRHGSLISNLKRCQINNVSVTGSDPGKLGELWPQCFDLVIVDAPCSGQSLLAKGEKALGCFHPATINMNSNRQKRILANSSKCVAGQGYLLYCTCTFSREENEAVIDWFLKRFPEFSPVSVKPLLQFQSHLVEYPCYRLFPFENLGAGAFTVLLRNNNPTQRNSIEFEAIRQIWQV